MLVLEVIRLAMNSEVQISDAWFNAIDKGTLQPDQKLKSLDLLILFQLYDLPNKRKSVESLFKNKIRSGKVTEELVRNCFKVCKYFLYKWTVNEVLGRANNPQKESRGLIYYTL